MYYITQTNKSFDQAVEDLTTQVTELNFGILHIHDIGNTLRSKGIDFKEECKVFEVCHPKHAATVLSVDMRLNMALPCRISVYTENGTTMLGLIKPEKMLAALSDDPALIAVAQEVEAATIQMIENAK